MASSASHLEERTPDENFYFVDGIVFLDGRLYAIQESKTPPAAGSMALQGSTRNTVDAVQVLDIGACEWEWKCRSQWKRCSSSFGYDCTDLWVACNGRIYSFHTCMENYLHGKVFDPENATWSEIKDRPIKTTALRRFCQSDYRNLSAVLNKEIYFGNTRLVGENMMVFDTVLEKWRTIPNTMDTDEKAGGYLCSCFSMIVVKGKLYSFSLSYIQRYNPDRNSWTVLHGSFIADFNHSKDEAEQRLHPSVIAVAGCGNEVIALIVIHQKNADCKCSRRKFCKSVSFGVDMGEKLIWEDFPGISEERVLADPSGDVLGYELGFILGSLEL